MFCGIQIGIQIGKACLARWQSIWQNASTGRQYHEYVPQVDFKRQFDLPDKVAFNRILQLQTGYTALNAHRHKVGQKVSPLCACGCPETTDHFLLQCQSSTSTSTSLHYAVILHNSLVVRKKETKEKIGKIEV